jgi:hypothetical protein
MAGELAFLIQELEKEGYMVVTETKGPVSFTRVRGRGFIAGYCTPHESLEEDDSYKYINGKFCADNIYGFKRWKSCPLQIDLPKNVEETNFLLGQLRNLGNTEMYEYTRRKRGDSITEYPTRKEEEYERRT